MGVLFRDRDTICALITTPGVGGIAVIRVSGDRSSEIVRSICPFFPSQPECHRVYYGFASENSEMRENLDEVLVTYFSRGRSFTGEETVEVSCHGGRVASGLILEALINSGARLAEKGEFTYRAYMSGRIDLVQAESILSLIESQSVRSARTSLRQLEGSLSKKIKEVEDSLQWALAHLEANIDFAYEDIQSASEEKIKNRIKTIVHSINQMMLSYNEGKWIKEGLRIALIGQPNAGKSSLMNFLIGENKSIVTSIPGTTRDSIEGQMMFEGIKITFVDTAGIRKTSDPIEVMGIEKTNEAVTKADWVWLIIDINEVRQFDFNSIKEIFANKEIDENNFWVVGHKSDLVGEETALNVLKRRWFETQTKITPNVFTVSNSKRELGCSLLKQQLKLKLNLDSFEQSLVLLHARHYELFKKTNHHLNEGLDLLQRDESPELVAFELREALISLYELNGKKFDDEILDRVFKEFCLGK